MVELASILAYVSLCLRKMPGLEIVMGRFFRSTIPAGLLTLLVLHAAAAAGLNWSQNLHDEEWIALTYKKPVVVLFVGNGNYDPSIFERESLEPIADQAEFVWVGADLDNKVAPDQIALERQFNVTQFPTLVLLRPVKTGTDAAGDHYSFRESTRCVENDAPGSCAQNIILAVETGQ
jgi:hypothetical protein